ncbi:MAG: hypothetical protein ABSF64_27390 [Bryobacteraceae bacterium]|jgi:hypothetical protein
MVRSPRNRVVVFRLTQSEYQKLKEASDERGAANLSDFTRSEVLAFLNSGTIPDAVRIGFAALEQEISRLRADVDSINRSISQLR